MTVYRYLVTVETDNLGVCLGHPVTELSHSSIIANEIDSNIDSVVRDLGIEDFDVTLIPKGVGFPELNGAAYWSHDTEPAYAPLSPDGRYQS